MTDQFILVSAENHDKIGAALAALPKEMREQIIPPLSDELVNIMRTQSKYQHITRAQAYPSAPAGPGWFSAKQRRAVMAMIRSGDISIPYQRTNKIRDGWVIIGQGENEMVVNQVSGVIYIMDDERQSNMAKLEGWKTVGQRLEESADRLLKFIRTTAAKIIRKQKL